MDPEFIGIHAPFDYCLPEPPGSINHHHATEAALCVQGEHRASAAEITADHLLDAHRECHRAVIELVLHPVRDGAISEERSHALADRSIQRFGTLNMEICFVLTCKRCRWQIFRSSAGSNRNIKPQWHCAVHWLGARGRQCAVGGEHLRAKVGWQRGSHDPLTYLLTCRSQRACIRRINRCKSRIDPVL